MYQLNPVLRDFWRSPKRYKALYGGRASSKSHDAAGFAVYLAANFTVKFLCARQFQNRISESVYTLIKDKIENSEFNGEFTLTKNSIIHKKTGSEFLFYGIARNLSEIKSTEGVDILWLEEAHYLTEEQWNIIMPTIRKKGSQIWLIWNPDNVTDFIYDKFVTNTPHDCIARMINHEENPYLSDTMRQVITDAYTENRKSAEHIYGGLPKTGADKAVINLSYILAAIDAHKKLGWEPAGQRVIGFDVADDGDDLCATIEAYGNVATGGSEWDAQEDELLKSCTSVHRRAIETESAIVWDSIGVGAHCGAKFKELNEETKFKIDYDPFNAGGGVQDPDKVYMKLPHTKILNKDHFSNIKAQKWEEVATKFRKTYEMINGDAVHPFDELISIDSSTFPPEILKKLKIELSSPMKDKDRSGRFKVESKDDMKKRGIKSPNIADAFIMAFIKPKRRSAGFFDI